jgi:hypothetical protein
MTLPSYSQQQSESASYLSSAGIFSKPTASINVQGSALTKSVFIESLQSNKHAEEKLGDGCCWMSSLQTSY